MNKDGETVFAFIDSQNLNLGVKNDIVIDGTRIYEGWTLDFQKFLAYLQGKHGVDTAFLFIGKKPGEEKLHRFLESAGYAVEYKPVIHLPGGGVKGNVDAELIMKAMTELPNYDKAIIVAGDGDYSILADTLDADGKLGRIIVPNKYSYSSLLRKYAYGRMSYVSDLRKRLEYK